MNAQGRIDDAQEKDYFQQVVEKKQNNMVKSSYRCLRLLAESEKVGAATGEELIRQGEVLRKAEARVEKTEQDIKESNRHLRSLKSVWGAFRNKFSKEPSPTNPVGFVEEDRKTPNKLKKAIRACGNVQDKSKNFHPILQRQEESRQMYSGNNQRKLQNSQMREVEDNLDLMGQSLLRLKDLGLQLQNEIDSQEPMLERLHSKVNRVDHKIDATNKKMIKRNK